MTPQCEAVYTRPDGCIVQCTFLSDHPDHQHSWWAMSQQDVEDYHPEILVVLSTIADGGMDPYLEAILNAAHNRKRTLRGVLGFELGSAS